MTKFPFGPTWIWLALTALIQTAALGKIVFDRQSLLKNGREITLQVVPVDPRDLFRGDYVILGYTISPIKRSDLADASAFDTVTKGSTVYVTLQPTSDGSWKVAAVDQAYPSAPGEGNAVLKGIVRYPRGDTGAAEAAIDVSFGIERYFVPEGTGKALEAKVRDNQIQAIVAVDSDGTAAMKGLIVGGERHEDPPLF
jgi:uncharacterized membrane-anchored protein